MTEQSQAIDYIPLSKLVASPRNVRRKDRKIDIDALAASISARGLLQNLCVVATDGDKFEVDAGGRRLLALKQLAKTGAIAKDFMVPCHVVAREEGREVSLIENIHRVSMDAMDEVEAYASLMAEGATPDEVARRFGVTRRHVDQRLALANLSPKIKAAWKRGDINLDAARAFCLVDDHAKQEAVFRSLGRPVTHAGSVRARLMESGMKASDRLAVYVGLETYEAAGGAIIRDLFDADAVFVGDPALMTRLAEQKLIAESETWLSQGWGWVDISLGQGKPDGLSPSRLQPTWRELTDHEEAELSRLRAEMAALDSAMEEDSVENDTRWDTRDTLAAQIETLRQSARVWDQKLIAYAGVILAISHDGNVIPTLGVVRKADEKGIRALQRKKASGETDGNAISDDQTDQAACDPEKVESGLSKTLIRELSLVRTRALRLLVARDRDVALALTVAAMLARAVFSGELSGIGVAAHDAHIDDLDELAETRGAILGHIPEDESEVLAWCLAQPSETLLAVLALLVAGAIDLTHERGAPSDGRRQNTADLLAQVLDLDMREYWQADASYWTRLSKAELMTAVADSPELIEMSSQAREASLKAHAKLKKDDLAAQVCKAFEGAGYLPDLLVTHLPAGRVELIGAAIVAAE